MNDKKFQYQKICKITVFSNRLKNIQQKGKLYISLNTYFGYVHL